jgi:hypothetical protein
MTTPKFKVGDRVRRIDIQPDFFIREVIRYTASNLVVYRRFLVGRDWHTEDRGRESDLELDLDLRVNPASPTEPAPPPKEIGFRNGMRIVFDDKPPPKPKPESIADISDGADIWPHIAETRALTGKQPIDLFGDDWAWHHDEIHEVYCCAFLDGTVMRIRLVEIEDEPRAPALAGQPNRARAEAIRSIIIRKAKQG